VNYLAHLYLAGESDGLIAGALLGDFVKGRLDTLPLPAEWVEGVRLHRAIDAFTDRHPVVVRSRGRFEERRRVAGIIVDLAYDHFLAVHWSAFCDEPLHHFCRRRYDLLLSRREQFPPSLRELLPRIAAQDWLGSYAELAKVAFALERIGSRLRRADLLADVQRDLERHYDPLERDFLAFFPELAEYAANVAADGLHRLRDTPR
jgi:acyl carrier protein phosphodiesterase